MGSRSKLRCQRAQHTSIKQGKSSEDTQLVAMYSFSGENWAFWALPVTPKPYKIVGHDPLNYRVEAPKTVGFWIPR